MRTILDDIRDALVRKYAKAPQHTTEAVGELAAWETAADMERDLALKVVACIDEDRRGRGIKVEPARCECCGKIALYRIDLGPLNNLMLADSCIVPVCLDSLKHKNADGKFICWWATEHPELRRLRSKDDPYKALYELDVDKAWKNYWDNVISELSPKRDDFGSSEFDLGEEK